LPPAKEAQVIGNQLLRCGTSVGANYRAACQARSKAEFIAKIGIVAEEADETVFWIELLSDTGIMKKERLEIITQRSTRVDRYFFCVTTDGKAKIAIGLQLTLLAIMAILAIHRNG